MKLVQVKDVEPGDIFLFQTPDQPMRAWIHLGIVPDGEMANHVWAESYFSYVEFGDWTPRKRCLGRATPQSSGDNHYPVKYLYLRIDQRVLA